MATAIYGGGEGKTGVPSLPEISRLNLGGRAMRRVGYAALLAAGYFWWSAMDDAHYSLEKFFAEGPTWHKGIAASLTGVGVILFFLGLAQSRTATEENAVRF